jgi:hypothetical protein
MLLMESNKQYNSEELIFVEHVKELNQSQELDKVNVVLAEEQDSKQYVRDHL